MNIFIENGITIEIHYTNSQETEMMIYIPGYQKTYFVSITNYDWQLRTMKSSFIVEIEKVIGKFLKEN